MTVGTADLRKRLEEFDLDELRSRVEAGVLTPEATLVAKEVLAKNGITVPDAASEVTEESGRKDFAKGQGQARDLWRSWQSKLTAFVGGGIAWNLARAITAQVLDERLGSIFVLLVVPLGYMLSRAIMRPVVANAETTLKGKRQFIFVALAISIVLLGITGAWSESVLRSPR